MTLLYNPRQDQWGEHFRLEDEGLITPLTATGRATVRLLQMNEPSQVEERRMLIEFGEL